MAPNKKLGKGLSSLLGNKSNISLDKKSENGLLLIPIENIFRDENQPRKEFDKEKIEELAQSIHKNGLIQPLILTKKGDNNFMLVAGERRWRAAQIANLKMIPSLLLPEDLDKDEISLIENIQRENLKISEEAQAYQGLIDKNKYTHEELAKIVGKSRSHITNLLRILSLDPYFFDLLNKGVLSMGHARALVGKRPEDLDEKVLNQISTGNITVRDIEKNKSNKTSFEPNLIQEEILLSQTIGLKSKITYSKSGKGNIKIFFNNLEQYNFLIKKLKN
ncbi:MAG: ParB/RepB/Spo0J family partition protein [Rickettsiales bacterium]|nr:ParB/RepB/Spo0J family partition protein [Rickettsiales bacterium]|tara:strand:- start:3115 stop:3945 length:831 start_codon:yes stop_codon:yes gene_type:complete